MLILRINSCRDFWSSACCTRALNLSMSASHMQAQGVGGNCARSSSLQTWIRWINSRLSESVYSVKVTGMGAKELELNMAAMRDYSRKDWIKLSDCYVHHATIAWGSWHHMTKFPFTDSICSTGRSSDADMQPPPTLNDPASSLLIDIPTEYNPLGNTSQQNVSIHIMR